MVRNGAKEVERRLDEAEWAGLDSLGFGLVRNDLQAERPEQGIGP